MSADQPGRPRPIRPNDGLHRPEQTIASRLLNLADQVRPFHEWLHGQRAHFNEQGYSDDEARAMAAALFVCVFGANITRTVITTDEDKP